MKLGDARRNPVNGSRTPAPFPRFAAGFGLIEQGIEPGCIDTISGMAFEGIQLQALLISKPGR